MKCMSSCEGPVQDYRTGEYECPDGAEPIPVGEGCEERTAPLLRSRAETVSDCEYCCYWEDEHGDCYPIDGVCPETLAIAAWRDL